MSLVPNSRRAAALSPVGARDCVEGQRSRKRGALHGLGGHQTRLRGPWEASHGKLGPTSTWLAGCSSNTSGRSSSLEVGWPGRREPCSRCWQQLGTGLQLVRLIGIATARGGAGAGGGRAVRVCLSGPCRHSGLRGRPIGSVRRASVGRALARLSGVQGVS